MRLEYKTDRLVTCVCGGKPDHYTVAYGRTPYNVSCPSCGKHTTMAKCFVTGHSDNLIDYWNKHVSKLTKSEMVHELIDMKKERKEIDPFNEYATYEYYWIMDAGEKLHTKCKRGR